MSVAVCHDAWAQIACMYDTTSGEAFGPVFTGPGAGEGAEEFLTWLTENGEELPRHLPGLPNIGGRMSIGTDAREWDPSSLRRIVQHFQDTVLDQVVGPIEYDKSTNQWREVENEGDGREPDGQRLEGHRVVPTDR